MASVSYTHLDVYKRQIEVYEIPYTTKTDIIIDRIIKLSKEGKVREIADIRDETDLSGLRIAICLLYTSRARSQARFA